MIQEFSFDCRRCTRLAGHLAQVRESHPQYHARPVAAFGPARASLLIVGLAPGMHGANRTGRPFTGDYAGILLYRTLHRYGFASRPESVAARDGLTLRNCRITNAVRCLPPGNRPLPDEVRLCNGYLEADIARVPDGGIILALGAIAHGAVLRALGMRPSASPFRHGARHGMPRRLTLYDSYHCSRYNTNTGRLTPAMFAAVLRAVQRQLSTGQVGRPSTCSIPPP